MTDTELWVFGYGSLMWHAEFDVAESVVATLTDHARSFCMWSIHHRGTPEHPGLVLALDRRPGRACTGLALRARPGTEAAALADVRARELVTSAYLEEWVELHLVDGRRVKAVTYIVDPQHEQYVADLPLEEQAAIIAGATGGRGPNTDYLYNTARHLHELGIGDADLDWLAHRVRQIAA